MNGSTIRQTLGKYQLLERLGQGGMAQVYRARQPVIERDVAIKVLHPHLANSHDFVERFKREARGLGQLRHPNIVSIIDFDTVVQPGVATGVAESDAEYYLVMDFIPGPTLADVLAQSGPLPLEDALLIGEQIADALAYAHQQGVIHRDVKPGNMMFRDQERRHPVLTDFGIVHLLEDAGLTVSGTLAGTPAYMSPEAANGGAIDPRADLYSLGVVLYELLTGATPYTGNTPAQLLMQHLTAPLPPLREKQPDLPEIVVQIIERALAKTPEARFQSAAAMRQAILQARLLLNDGHAPQTQMLPSQTLIANQSNQRPVSRQFTRQRTTAAASLVAAATPTVAAHKARPMRQGWSRIMAAVALLVLTVSIGVLLVDLLPFAEATAGPGGISTGEEVGRLQIMPTANGQEIELALHALASPPAGKHYHAWIVAQEGMIFDLGALTVSQGEVHHLTVAQQNVLGSLTQVLITQETVALPTAPSVQIMVRGAVSAARATAFTHLWAASELPLAKPLLPAAAEQIAIAQEHLTMLNAALKANNLVLGQRHAEHLVNILDGETGNAFGDLNLDGQAQNPGDGVGVRLYLTETGATFVALGLDRAAVDNGLAAVANLISAARQVAAADTLAEAQRAAAQMSEGIEQLLHGVDDDGAGAVKEQHDAGSFLRVQVAGVAVFPLYRVTD